MDLPLETTVALVANVSLALSFIAALIFGVTQARAGARDRRERLTIEALRPFQTREFAERLQQLRTKTPPATAAELYTLPVHEQVAFIHLAQEMETLGTLVSEGLVELDLVEKILGSWVSWAWGKYRALFLEMRVQNQDVYLAEYFEWLAARIDARMREAPRKPMYA